MASKAVPQPLKLETPMSATFPSEIHSPAIAMSPSLAKREEVDKTPISPPAAYLSFLSKISSTSPPATASLPAADQDNRPSLTSHPSVESVVSDATTGSDTSMASSVDSVVSQASQSTTVSDASAGSVSTTASTSTIELERTNGTMTSTFHHTRQASASEPSVMGKPPMKPALRPVTIPKAPYSPGPESAKSLRRLHIPQSPYSPRMASPSLTSPMIASPLSAGVLMSPYTHAYSPRDREFGAGAVGMRQTITRYISIPNKSAPVMEPVPASKKRKIEQT